MTGPANGGGGSSEGSTAKVQADAFDAVLEAQRPVRTGKYLVTLRQGDGVEAQREALKATTQGRVESAGFFEIAGIDCGWLLARPKNPSAASAADFSDSSL